MRALSIRQPYAEMILRGEKTIEYRSRPVGPRLIGQRFYIYAGEAKATKRLRDVETKWIEDNAHLPRGLIVGTAVISHVTNGGPPGPSAYEWHLTDVQRLKRPRPPRRRPQPVWFRPF